MNFVARSGGETGPRLMKHGDLTIIYERHDNLNHIYLSKGDILNNKFGAFYHDDIIGKPFGSKIVSRNTSGWMYALEPSPELWSLAVHTRTQIVNELDASIITFNLDVFPGCVVVESGTGSGCMTLSLARAIAPTGHVFTFEYNPARSKEATEEFVRLGVSHLVTVTCKDVCGKYSGDEGGFSGVANQIADAVFLDLPEPWLAIDHVMRVLKPGKNLCTYSPCIEQVMKTCDKLRESGFHTIRMMEVRQRPYDGRRHPFETVDLGLGEGTKNPAPVPSENPDKADLKKCEGSDIVVDVVCNSGEEVKSGDALCGGVRDGKRALDEEVIAHNSPTKKARLEKAEADGKIELEVEGKSSSSRMTELEREKEKEEEEDAQLELEVQLQHGNRENKIDETEEEKAERELRELRQAIYLRRVANKYVLPTMPVKEVLIGRPLATMKGHTAFLTFAVRPPLSQPEKGK